MISLERTRLTAKKTSIEEIAKGKFVKKQGFESSYVLTRLGRKLSRVRILGLIVDKFVSPDEKYAAITLDDGTETIRCKSFVNTKLFNGFVSGDLVDIFGKIREYNEEIYVTPEILRKVHPNFEILRILDLNKILLEQKNKIKKVQDLKKSITDLNELKNALEKYSGEDLESIIEAGDLIEVNGETNLASNERKSIILNLISKFDKGDGTDYQDILKNSNLSEIDVDSTIQDLLESGICFEPKPGKIKRL